MRHLVNTNNVFHPIFTYSKIRYTFYDPINKKLGFFKFCPPDMMCVQNSGRLFWCSGLSWLMWQKFSTTVGYHDQSSRLPWRMWWKSLLRFLIFFLLNRPLYWASTMYIMIKHTVLNSWYAIMVTHHMHYDNPPLYHTHFMEVLGFKIYSQWTLANQLTQQVSAIMVL